MQVSWVALTDGPTPAEKNGACVTENLAQKTKLRTTAIWNGTSCPYSGPVQSYGRLRETQCGRSSVLLVFDGFKGR